MKPNTFYYFHLIAAVSFSQAIAHSPILAGADDSRQQPIMASSSDQPRMQQNNVMLSDVMGRDRSINLFASLTRDVASIEQRLEDPSQNSTVLAPLNSKVC